MNLQVGLNYEVRQGNLTAPPRLPPRCQPRYLHQLHLDDATSHSMKQVMFLKHGVSCLDMPWSLGLKVIIAGAHGCAVGL